MRQRSLFLLALALPTLGFSDGLAPSMEAKRTIQKKKRELGKSQVKERKSHRQSWRSSSSQEKGPSANNSIRGDGFFTTAEFAYLFAKQSNLYAGELGVNNVSPVNSNFNWSPGISVGFGYKDRALDWDLGASYTYLSSNPRTGAAGTITPIETSNTYSSLYQSWKLNYQQLEFMLKGPAYKSSSFSFNFGLGVEATYARQLRTLTYSSDSGTLGINDKNRMTGAGPLMKLLSRFKLNENFGLVADLGASLLWGVYDCTRQATGDSTLRTTNSHSKITWSLKSRAGLDWVGSDANSGFSLFLGWQMTSYFDQWGVYGKKRARLNSKGGDLTLSGFVFSTEVCF